MREEKRQPTAKQEKFVEAVMLGKSNSVAALEAGYSSPSAPKLSDTVRQEIEAARKDLQDITKIKRTDVILGMLEGIHVAKIMSDAGNIIKGWSEIGKMHGYYAPETKNINLTIEQRSARGQIEAMSDEDLLDIVNGNTLEGEFTKEENAESSEKT